MFIDELAPLIHSCARAGLEFIQRSIFASQRPEFASRRKYGETEFIAAVALVRGHMTGKRPAFPGLRSILFFILCSAHPTAAQTSKAAPQITQAIDAAHLVVLHGKTYPLARTEFDQAAA